MKRFSLKLLIVTVILCSISCNKDHLLDAFKSSGSETSITRLLPSFTSIRAGGKFDVVLIQDSTLPEQVQVTAGKNIIDGITTEVNNGKLEIKNSNKANWARRLKVRFKVVIVLKSIDKLEIEGAAKVVTGKLLNVPTLDVQHNGIEDAVLDVRINNLTMDCKKAGGVVLSGRANIFSGSFEDLSRMDGRNLYTSDAYITSYAVNSSYVYAEKRMSLKVFGNGNLYYLDQPTDFFEKEEHGPGRVIKL